MALIDLKTNLKDLKFGNDELGGGDSGQPYIQTRIPATDEPLQTSFSVTGTNIGSGLGTAAVGAGAGAILGAVGGSFFGAIGTGALIGAGVGLGMGIAGGVLTQGSSVSLKVPSAGTGGNDFLIRGGTLFPNIVANDVERLAKFFKSTNGALFVVKQNLLSRVSVRTQASTGLLNEGTYTPISTLLEAAGNPLGIHVNKQGLNPFDSTFYAAAVKNIREPLDNRLARLTETVINRQNLSVTFGKFTLGSTTNIDVLSYQGGPGSVLGIGKTHIPFATNNVGVVEKTSGATTDYTLTIPQLDEIYQEAKTQKVVDFRKKLKQNPNKEQDPNKTRISNSPPYDPGKNKTIEQRVNLGDPGNESRKDLTSYVNGNYGGAASDNSFDRINASVLYQSTGPQNKNGTDPDTVNNDLVKFRIGVISNNNPSQKTYIHFRAFLDNISDQYISNWDATRYIGRGENFYTYTGFDRKVSLSWTVAAQSKIELIPMYKRLNYLASVCTPDYSGFGYMRGNIVTLTVGGYFYEQYGIITGFSYEMNEDSDSWEIGINDEGTSDSSVKELPHIIRVKGFNFIPIHNFVPRLQQNNYDEDGDLTSYGQERYIALSAGGKTNYDA